jgi:hypothetical protein
LLVALAAPAEPNAALAVAAEKMRGHVRRRTAHT